MKKIITVILAGILVSVLSVNAIAQPISFTKTAPLIAVTLEDGTKTFIQSSQLQLLGRDEQGDYILFTSDGYVTADSAVLSGVLGSESLQDLPGITDFRPLPDYAQGQAVSDFQRALIQLGYMDGNPDGDFGGKTKQAVIAFQRDIGLEPNGVVDELLQMLLLSMAQEPAYVTRTASFDAIRERTESNLQPIIDSGMLLEYDDITGTGWISSGEPLQIDASGEADIDRYYLSIQCGFSVQDEENGMVSVLPSLMIDCNCARRPVMQSITLKSGDARSTLPVPSLKTCLDGIYSIEKAVIPLGEAELSLLNTIEDNGELKIHIEGKYRSFNLIIPQDNLSAFSAVGRTAIESRK